MDNYIRKALVTHIVDGDTFDAIVDLGYGSSVEIRFRLLGVDTPERGQEGYQEAKDYLEQEIGNREVYIASRKFQKGGFGRYLGVVYYANGNLNENLLELNLATPYIG
jgi:micrococcal nuclease